MSTINSISGNSAIQQIINAPIQSSLESDSAQNPRSADRLELSGVSQIFQSLQANNVRTDLVTSVRSQIDAGTYETDDKLNSATDKLLDDLS
jgi:anti-sigma28 factor (negative regulator of flagellin synthesis)